MTGLTAWVRPFEPATDWPRFVVLNHATFWDSIPQGEEPRVEEFRKHHAWLLEKFAPGDPQRARLTVAAGPVDDYMGHCWMGVNTDFFTNAPQPWVFDLSVKQQYRGNGIGKLLLDDCAHWCRQAGFTGLGLQVMAHNDGAVRFYRREGFGPRAVTLQREL